MYTRERLGRVSDKTDTTRTEGRYVSLSICDPGAINARHGIILDREYDV